MRPNDVPAAAQHFATGPVWRPVVDGSAFKQIGEVTPGILDQTILSLVRKLQQKGPRTP